MAGNEDEDAAAEADALRINTLHRFAKHSPKLVLHEYSHCEVPAGCGGVVLRWLDPETGRPCIITLGAIGLHATVWLDGEPVARSLCNLRDGERVVALALARRPAETVGGRPDAEAGPGDKPFFVDVHPDGMWDRALLADPAANARYKLHVGGEPPAGWQGARFDDAAWPAAPRCPAGVLAGMETWQRRRFERLRDSVHVLAAEHARAWLRVSFIARVPEREER